MPLSNMVPNPTPEQVEKAHQVRQKILRNARQKYLFHFQECSKPVDILVEEGRLAGLVFQKTNIVENRVEPIAGSEFKVRSPLIISSIGSVPEPIPGIPTRGELFKIPDPDTGKLEGYDNVFGLGNAVTGKGNIRESELHARKIADHIIDQVFHCRAEHIEENRMEDDSSAGTEFAGKGTLNENQMQSIINRIKELQRKAGYEGNYQRWIERHRPVRLEHLLTRSGPK
jgi:hypothetical protein